MDPSLSIAHASHAFSGSENSFTVISEVIKLGLLQSLGLKKTIAERKPKSPQDFQLRSNAALFTPKNTRFIMERVPLSWIAKGRITESDLALASTTPVLGQYAPTFGWPDSA
jgi:hypothetical protein